MTTLQAAAIAATTDLAAIAQQIRTLRGAIADFAAKNTSNNYDAIWKVLPTFAWAADGSAGAADGSPVNTHPISSGGINLSENTLLGMVYLIQDFQTFLSGGALAATGSRSATVDQILG